MADNEHAKRLLHGMAKSISARGYGVTTIADIVAEASVSRRTFYEHFPTKSECLLALYVSVNIEALSVLKSHVNPGIPWRHQVQVALTAYFGWMAKNPALMRALFIDILALGEEGLKVRRLIHEEVATFIVQTVSNDRPNAPPLAPDLLIALVGGIHELVLQKTEKTEKTENFQVLEIAQVSADFVRLVFSEDVS